MTCPRCGAQLADGTTSCPYCGTPIQYRQPVYQPPQYQQPVYPNPYGYQPVYDAPNFGFALLSFFIPLVGLILWLSWKDTTPLKAGSCGKGALAGFLTNIAISILYSVIFAAAFATMY